MNIMTNYVIIDGIMVFIPQEQAEQLQCDTDCDVKCVTPIKELLELARHESSTSNIVSTT